MTHVSELPMFHICNWLIQVTGRIIESRNIHFNEGSLGGQSRVLIDVSDDAGEGELGLVSQKEDRSVDDIPHIHAFDSDNDDDFYGEDTTQGTHQHVPVGAVGAEASGTASGSSSASTLTSDASSATTTQRIVNPTTDSDSATSNTPRTTATRGLRRGVPPPPTQPYPSPPPPPEVRRSSRLRRTPLRDDDDRFNVTSYGIRARSQAPPPSVDNESPQESNAAADAPSANPADAGPSVGAESAKTSSVDPDPLTYEEAMSRPDAKEWKKACAIELEEFVRRKLFTEAPRPVNRKVIDCKWVFKRKIGPTGKVERYKARLVAKGFTQVEGIDYDETFSPVTRYATIRTLLALSARKDWHVHHIDIKSAFTNPEIDRLMYMEIAPPNGSRDKVWELNRSVYGLKQAAYEWYNEVLAMLKELGFKRSEVDHGLFYKEVNGVILIIPVYVDDFTIVGNDEPAIAEFKAQVSERYEITDLGKVRWILGMHIERDESRRLITISQEQYINNILERFGMSDCRPVSTPMDPNTTLPLLKEPEPGIDVQDYQSRVGSLQHLLTCSRMDIAYAVGVVSRHNHAPGKVHLAAVDRIFRYLRGTSDYVLVYDGNSNPSEPIVYSDSDFAADKDERKSVSGVVAMLSGAAISWSSKKQSCTAQSSTEAEFVAGGLACQEALWLRHLFSTIGLTISDPTPLLIDNQSAIHMIKNGSVNERTKHIDIKYRFICGEKENGNIEPEYIPTGDQIADICTKALAREKFYYFVRAAGLRPRSEVFAR